MVNHIETRDRRATRPTSVVAIVVAIGQANVPLRTFAEACLLMLIDLCGPYGQQMR